MAARAAVDLASLRRIRVGSIQPPKLEAVREAFAAYTGEPEVVGVQVASGVPEQPVGFAEIIRGAKNRAERALASGACDLGAGIEDGLVSFSELEGSVLNIGCAWLTDGERTGFGFSSGFAYPPECGVGALGPGPAVGERFDALFRDRVDAGQTQASGPGEGNIGRLSRGVLTRAEYGRHAVLCALVRFVFPDFYTDSPFVSVPNPEPPQ